MRLNFLPVKLRRRKEKVMHARFAVTLHSAKVAVVAHDELVNVNNT